MNRLERILRSPKISKLIDAQTKSLLNYLEAPILPPMVRLRTVENEELAKTKTIRRLGNYTLRDLDGRRWWSRAKGGVHDADSRHGFPRNTGEGFTPWYSFNRHQRKHGLPKGCMSELPELLRERK